MMKIAFLSLIVLCFITRADAQKIFELTIKLDTSINPKKIQYQYNNGKNVVFFPDTFGNRRAVLLRGEYYGPMASFIISYTDSAKNGYGNNFFITNRPAEINFFYVPNDDAELKYKYIKNADRIYDTTANEILRGLLAYTKKDNLVLGAFMKKHNGNIFRVDTVRRTFKRLFKAGIVRAMEYLKQYPNDYFSFWYFRDQVIQLPNGPLNTDTAFLQIQLAYFKEVFPPKFTESIEGKELTKTYEIALNPIKKGMFAPPFSMTTPDGKKLNLSDFKGKYVLLDFWATWCAPVWPKSLL